MKRRGEKTWEFDIDVGLRCAVEACNKTFEGEKPDDWGIVVVDNIMVASNHPPYTFHMFFCPEHWIAYEQIENVETKLEYAPGSGGFDLCFYGEGDETPTLRVGMQIET